MASATIFIVDDDASVRKGLARLMRSAGWNAESFPSANEFLTRPAFTGTGCAVLDVRMPGITGPELYEQMIRHNVSLPVIFLTGHGDVPTSVQEMKLGAVDFLEKPVDDEVLLKSVRLALERHSAGRAREQERAAIRDRVRQLTRREREVMQYVIAGCLNKQIADQLGIAERTIKVHRGRLMHKMQVASVAELVRLCEIVEIPPTGHGNRADMAGKRPAAPGP